jgi:2-(1,2-epoxy-1,2-dihydrophenyl)acetyl-CoA isomerase
MTDYQAIRYEVDNRVGILTLNRPESLNALDITMRNELADILPKIRADKSLCALIMTGSGGAFCAGGDLKSLSESERTPHDSRERIALIHTWFPELNNLEMPVISAVDGPAYGGGFNLALAADFVLCTPRAKFCSVFGRIGLVPDVAGFFLLPRLIGLQKAKDLIFSSRSVGAEEAVSMGLAYSIHEPDDLLPAALRMAGRFRHASREAIGMSKSILNQSFNLDQRALADLEGYAQAIAMASTYHREAVQKFIDKEPLTFNWDQMDKEERDA